MMMMRASSAGWSLRRPLLLMLLLGHAAAAASRAHDAGEGAHAASNAAAAADAAEGGCPAWLAAYAAFHAKARNDPDAKYLVWTCNLEHRAGNRRYTIGSKCNGLGDRLRGIMWMTRVAAAARRVLLVMERKPAPLEMYLEPPPGGIDWRTDPELEAYTLEVANAAAPGRVRHTRSASTHKSADYKKVHGSC